jgi:Glucose-6-phosphate dehydrogenase, NAD binding domain
MMSDSYSDALTFFGAAGDLAHKKIFPSLQAMLKRGHLDVPVIGVAKSGSDVEGDSLPAPRIDPQPQSRKRLHLGVWRDAPSDGWHNPTVTSQPGS